MASEAPAQAGQLPSSPVVREIAMGTNHRTARIIAIVAGLLGAALALATPLLPVEQTTAQLNWPQNGVLQSVNAPLIGYVATDLTISVPCQAAAGLAGPQNQGRTVLLSTVPKQAPKAVDRGLLIERVNNDLLVIVRNTPVVSAPMSQVLSPDVRTADVHRTCRQGHRRVRRAGAGTRRRRPRRPAARRAQRLRLPPADRRGVHRSVRARAAGPGVLRDRSTPATAARRRC